jgi:hypothetical protein
MEKHKRDGTWIFDEFPTATLKTIFKQENPIDF